METSGLPADSPACTGGFDCRDEKNRKETWNHVPAACVRGADDVFGIVRGCVYFYADAFACAHTHTRTNAFTITVARSNADARAGNQDIQYRRLL